MPFIGIVFLAVFLFANSRMEKRFKRHYYVLLILELVELTFYSLELTVAQMAEPSWLRILFSAVGYTLRPAIAYIILLLSSNESVIDKKNIFLFSLLPINTLIAFSAFWTGAAYSYSAANEFVRGPLGFSSQIISCIYLLFAVYQYVRNIHKKIRVENIVLIGSVFVIIFGFYVEAAFQLRGIGQMSMVLATMIYYMYLQTQVYHTYMDTSMKIRKDLEIEAKNDGLTNLLNKKAFLIEAEKQIQESKSSWGLIFFDLDDFRSVNNRFGHVVGDQLLVKIGQQLKAEFMPYDLISRFGGDEFWILLRRVSYEKLEEKMKETLESMRIEYYYNNEKIRISASIGGVFIPSGTKIDLNEAIKIADDASYEAKQSGKNKYFIKRVAGGREMMGLNDIKLEKAVVQDVSAVARFYKTIIGREGCTWNEQYPTKTNAEYDCSNGNLYVVKDNTGVIIGAVSIVTENELDNIQAWKVKTNHKELARIAISEEYMGKGYAAEMLRQLFDELKNSGCAAVHILAAVDNSSANHLYDSFGFSYLGKCLKYGHEFYIREKEL